MAQDHGTHRRHDRHDQQYHEDNANRYSDIEHLFPGVEDQVNLGNVERRRASSFQRRGPSAPRSATLKRSVSTGSKPSDLPKIIVNPPDEQKLRYWRESLVPLSPSDQSAASTRRSSVTTDSSGEKPFEYFDLQSDQIRLVCILPATMLKVKCEIIHVSLDDVQEYVAISYAWGDAGDQEHIYLGDKKRLISKSLHGALSALRDAKKEVYVWADALCINQQNMVEKSNQIKLMTSIYAGARFVAVWLGPEEDNSRSALAFLDELRNRTISGKRSRSWIMSRDNEKKLAAVARLFSRSYWKRLWVVQEVFNAADIVVCCENAKIPWKELNEASSALYGYQSDLSDLFAKNSSRHHVQSLFNEGPRSFLDPKEFHGRDQVLLEVLRRCRRKISEKPQDKVFGLLGVLPETTRKDFRVDYNLSVKEVFTDVVDSLVHTTASLDVICESIHFPEPSNPHDLPSWVPDWSHNPNLKSLSLNGFSASGDTTAEFKFRNRRNELEITAVYLDTVRDYGVSVGTQCTLADYLMAFLHWRALLVDTFGRIKDSAESRRKHEDFCRTLNLDQDPSERPSDEWMQTCYHVFSSLIQDRLPSLELDSELRSFAKAHTDVHREGHRQFLQDKFGEYMMGRAFCITNRNRMGMGSGAMLRGDIIVVPFGCRTPVILRADPFSPSKYRLVGDVYLDQWMRGRALERCRLEPDRRREYVLV